MKHLVLALVLFSSQVSAAVYGGSIRSTRTYQTPFPSCGLVAYGFTIQSNWNANVYDCSGNFVRAYGPVKASGDGWCSGAFFMCGGAPTFHPDGETLTSDGLRWAYTVNVLNAEASASSCGGYHTTVAGPLYVPLPTCCLKDPNCSGSCIALCDGTCRCTPIAVRFGSHYDFVALNQGPFFRVDPDGPQQQMTWPTGKTGWLVHPDAKGQVNSIQGEMFDYPRLAKFDANHDGKIDALEGRELRIWFDNGDGIVQSGELHSLPELKVEAISLTYHELGWDNGKGTEIWLVSAVDTPQLNKPCQAADALITVRP